MKKILNIWLPVALLIMTVTAGCTSNNGDIGTLFGVWHLDRMAVDGEDDTDYDGNCFWSFQNNIICISVENDPLAHAPERSWGTWSRRGNCIVLNFAHKAGDGDQQQMYVPPAMLRLPADADIPLAVQHDSGDRMTLVYDTPDGAEIAYYLVKF